MKVSELRPCDRCNGPLVGLSGCEDAGRGIRQEEERGCLAAVWVSPNNAAQGDLDEPARKRPERLSGNLTSVLQRENET